MTQETKYKSSIYKEFKERKYINKKTKLVETKITTRNKLLRNLLIDFRYDENDCDVYYKEIDLCDWEEAITAIYMFSPQHIENDEYYEGKYDTITGVYRLPATKRKAIYDLFQYLSDPKIIAQWDKVIFNYEKFEDEYVEIKDDENDEEFLHYVDVLLSPLVNTIQKESYELSMIWSGLIVHLTNEETEEILKDCEEITRKYKELSGEVEGICERVTDITLEYKGEEL